MAPIPKNSRHGGSPPIADAEELRRQEDAELLKSVRALFAEEERASENAPTGLVVVGRFRRGAKNTSPQSITGTRVSRSPAAPPDVDGSLVSLQDAISAEYAVFDGAEAKLGPSSTDERSLGTAFCAAYSALAKLRSVSSGAVRKHVLSLGPIPFTWDVEVFDNLCNIILYLLFYGNRPHYCGIQYDAASEYIRRALGSMDSEKRKRTIVTLMALAGELQNAKVLDLVPVENLALIAGLLSQASQLAQPAREPAGPPLFASRKRDPETLKRPTAIEWFDLYWRERVDRGEVFANDLKAHDLKLYQALSAHQSREGGTLADLLPIRHKRKSQMSADELAAHRQRVSERAAFRARRSRQNRPKGA